MRVSVSLSYNLNEAVVRVEPGWFLRWILGAGPREFQVQRAACITGGNRWWSSECRAYVKSPRILDALDRAWWAADRAERHEAVKATFGRRMAAERQRLRAELGLD